MSGILESEMSRMNESCKQNSLAKEVEIAFGRGKDYDMAFKEKKWS